MKILLASQSPRRKELLSALGYSFDVVKIDCDETYSPELQIDHIAEYLSEKKASAYGTIEEGSVLITADTIVAIGPHVLGKPKDKAEAREMLKLLSNNVHQVYTGITVKTSEQKISVTDKADVHIMPLTDEEIDYYIEHYKPFDKAGSYGVQEWLGMAKISKIEGSYYTIMGLPTHLLYSILSNLKS